MSARARILIVDDHYVVRQGVRSILTARPDWEVCGEATNGQEAVQAAITQQPDIIIMDITMPVMSGLDAAGRIAKMKLDTAVLILTMHEFGQLTKDIRRVGARGYVQKARAGRDLVRAIDALLDGGSFFVSPIKPEPNASSGPGPEYAHRMALRLA